jgi:hypothetical protein
MIESSASFPHLSKQMQDQWEERRQESIILLGQAMFQQQQQHL